MSSAIEKARVFAAELISAGERSGFGGLRWKPFVNRDIVSAILERGGFDLCEDGANHDPKLRRFFAAPRRQS